jgi:uncharacterized membrane protein (DUF4010 family)
MEEMNLFFRFGVSMVIGVLIGLQREYAYDNPEHEIPAGVRTYALMGLLGCTAAMVSDIMASALPFAAMLLIVGAYSTVIYYLDSVRGKVGLTTRISALLMIFIGALCYRQDLALAVALGVAAMLLLSIKLETHRLVQHVTREDLMATIKFAVITAIILPVLPNRLFGPAPFTIFNPLKIWLFVVFISSISFVGYLLVKLIGSRRGIGITGFFGGIASSTALTFSFTDRSCENPELSKSFALAITVAWTVMFFRIIIVVAVFNSALARVVWLPLVIAAAVGLFYCYYLYRKRASGHHEDVTFSNPFKLGPAIKFGLLFTIILFIAKSAQYYFGSTGTYLSSFCAGLADVDAIAFSMAKLSLGNGGIAPAVAGRAVMLAAVANTFLKGGIVLFSGSAGLRRDMLPGFILMTVAAVAAIFIM